MPPNLDSAEKSFMKHSSKPYNPKQENVFFKSGMIEAGELQRTEPDKPKSKKQKYYSCPDHNQIG